MHIWSGRTQFFISKLFDLACEGSLVQYSKHDMHASKPSAASLREHFLLIEEFDLARHVPIHKR
jgi:hypothetical protein